MAWTKTAAPHYRENGDVAREVVVMREAEPDDIDKTLDMTADVGKFGALLVKSIYIETVSTATAGNRLIGIQLLDSAGAVVLDFTGDSQSGYSASGTKAVLFALAAGFVNATADFTDHPAVINGASDFIGAVFGDKGAHARAAVGCVSLPLGVAVEIEGVFEIR